MSDNNTKYYDRRPLENNEIISKRATLGFKLSSFLLLVFSSLGWFFTIFSILYDSNDAYLPWGCLFFVVMSFLTYFVAAKFKKDFRVKKEELYFKVSHDSIEYTTINEMSGGIILRQILWDDVIKNPEHDLEADIYFYNNGYKNNTKNIVFYVSSQAGAFERVLIPVHIIKKLKDSWKIIRAILITASSLEHKDLIISEEVFYYFNINPETFKFRKKSMRRRLSDVFIVGASLVMGIFFAFLLVGLGGKLNIDLKYLIIPILIFSIAVFMIVIFILTSYVSFFINSYPEFVFVGYKKHKHNNELQNNSEE